MPGSSEPWETPGGAGGAGWGKGVHISFYAELWLCALVGKKLSCFGSPWWWASPLTRVSN